MKRTLSRIYELREFKHIGPDEVKIKIFKDFIERAIADGLRDEYEGRFVIDKDLYCYLCAMHPSIIERSSLAYNHEIYGTIFDYDFVVDREMWPGTMKFEYDTDWPVHYNCLVIDSSYEPKIAPPEIKKVLFNKPYTIVFWKDGTKTIVKTQKKDRYDKEKGLAMAMIKKIYGTNKNKSNYYDVVKEWI